MITDVNSEDRLVQNTFAAHLRNKRIYEYVWQRRTSEGPRAFAP